MDALVRTYRRLAILVLLLILAVPAAAQDLPDKIRGYKVHRAKVSVTRARSNDSVSGTSDAGVTVGEPAVVHVSPLGITFELTAEIAGIEQSTRIDFLSFHDLRVNGIKVEAEEFRESFEIRRGHKATLPKPARFFVSSAQAAKAVWKEFTGSDEDWEVTGRMFVFGRFRKFGFEFRRVVPVDIRLSIKNPLRDADPANAGS